MNSMYRFSPIGSEEVLKNAIAHVGTSLQSLSQKIVGEKMHISYLTIFAHYEDEYAYIHGIFEKWGIVTDANNGVKVTLDTPITFDGQEIALIRVRKPDPYRPHVGCGDFAVPDYEAFKAQFFGRDAFVRLVSRPDYEMIEIFHPDFDVLGYVMSREA